MKAISEKNERLCFIATEVIRKELTQAKRLIEHIDQTFALACQSIGSCKGKVIVSGIGKSGHIGKKIAATLASTGTPSFFIHAAEALHGDLGMVGSDDQLLMISNSGEASEFKVMLPVLRRKSVPVIAMTGNKKSYLAKNSTYTLSIASDEEACPLGLAPTSSAVNTLVLGDALALTIMTIRGFNRHDFALSHPAGALGSRLLTTVSQLIDDTHKAAFCAPETTISDAIRVMCQTGLGLLAIVKEQKVIGVFTDGDLRRALSASHDLSECIKTVMTTSFTQIAQDQLGSKALDIMHQKGITALPVSDKSGHFYGVMNMNTLQKAGIL